MLKHLQEYVMADSYDDHPVYGGFRYRSGGVIRVERGDRVITLEKLTIEEDAPVPTERNWPWLGQLITDDDRNGKKIRLYPSEIEIEGQVSTRPRVAVRSTVISNTDWMQGSWGMQQTTVTTPYVNIADSILREEDDGII